MNRGDWLATVYEISESDATEPTHTVQMGGLQRAAYFCYFHEMQFYCIP